MHSQTLRFQNHGHADLSEILYHYFRLSAFTTLPYIRSIGQFIKVVPTTTATKIQAHTMNSVDAVNSANAVAITAVSAVSIEIS